MTTNPQAGCRADLVAGRGSTSVRVIVAVALVCLLSGVILLLAGIRADGVDCGSPVASTAKASGSVRSGACEEALDTRRALAWAALGASAAFAVVGVGLSVGRGRATGDS
ncbi:hypothetical protein ACFYVR_24120 [Rhodococcus sp. NPDC003318]|uniref:hypothetical protein n=1 Tax=Rhodococcus sp. NPDC003318 TaxID=3364503 RepID=UPI0036B9E7FF